MDRTKLMRSRGSHKGFVCPASTQNEAASSSNSLSRGAVRGSQKLSNSELLRRKTRSLSNVQENKDNSSKSSADSSAKNVIKSKSQLSRRSTQSHESLSKLNDEAVNDICDPNKIPCKQLNSSVEQRNSSGSEDEQVLIVAKAPDKQLLSRRKRFLVSASDSDSDQEQTIMASPSKKRKTDPRSDKEIMKPPASPIRTTQLSIHLLSGGSSLSLRRTGSQRESNSSKLKKLASPMKVTDEQSHQRGNSMSPEKRANNKLEDFFQKSGVKLSQDDSLHEIDDDPPIIEQRMIKLFSSGKFKKEEIVDLWNSYVNDTDNLKKALNNVAVISDQQSPLKFGSNVSLVRILLQIPAIQTAVSDNLLQKLNEAVLIVDSMDDVPWAPLLLQQFRFLELIVDTDSLTSRLEELLETCPIWFQRELILFLPDIIIDVQHHAITEMLSKLMETHTDLTNVILDCITNLTLGKEYLEELREKILNLLKNNLEVARIPAMARFVLNECPTAESCQKTLSVLRSLDLQPLSGENSAEYFSNQMLLVNGLKMSILLSKRMADAATLVVKSTDAPAKALDLIILLLIFNITSRKKKIEVIFRQHIKTGFYRPSLLNSFYNDYSDVARELQPESLQLASNLLKAEDRIFVDFSIEWFRHQFVNQAEAAYKQREIIERIILLMGNNDHTAKNALKILRRMTENDKEKRFLQMHCNHLRILLEKIDNFDLEEVATLSDLLYALCTSSNSASDTLQDDLFILMQKQLSNAKTLTKCKGVLGAAMAIKHLAGRPESCKVAQDIFIKVRAGIKNCPRSQALFYDQIGRVIAETNNIESVFLNQITTVFQDEFVNVYLMDMDTYRGELEPKFGLNDSEPQQCVIHFIDGKHGAVVPALFRLLRICVMRIQNGDLADINTLLGCPVLMPKDMDIPEPWILDLIICCINWFRELISAFLTQSDQLMQEQVLKRLENLMELQGEFSTMITLCDTRYQPPPCYFHLFPAPPFSKVEKKLTKKGKRGNLDKTGSLPEWEAWEIGSLLSSKNPTYFRQFDAKIVDILDLKMDKELTQSPRNISKAQVCFIIKELLGMFEGGEGSENFVRDLIHLLPKICSKLQDLVAELRDREDIKNKVAAKLFLMLLTTIFEWRGFKSAIYNSMLRDGLRTLAGQADKANSMLRSSKELVAESYKYFESLADVANQIALALALVKMCRALMKHSESFTEQHKNKQAIMAFGFLSLQWPDDRPSGAAYATAVHGLLSNWMQNEPNPLTTVTTVLEWLPDEVAKLEKPQDRLQRLPSITRANFHYMFQKLFDGLIKGAKISAEAAKTDPERIEVWRNVANNIPKMVQVSKMITMRSLLINYLRHMPSLLKLFLTIGMPIMEHNLRYQMEDVTTILKLFRIGTRYLNAVCCYSTEKKDVALAKLVPPAKSEMEKLIFRVKGMLIYNNSSEAFWMGNLVNRNLNGEPISSQSSEDVSITSAVDDILNDPEDDVLSEILESDAEADVFAE